MARPTPTPERKPDCGMDQAILPLSAAVGFFGTLAYLGVRWFLVPIAVAKRSGRLARL